MKWVEFVDAVRKLRPEDGRYVFVKAEQSIRDDDDLSAVTCEIWDSQQKKFFTGFDPSAAIEKYRAALVPDPDSIEVAADLDEIVEVPNDKED